MATKSWENIQLDFELMQKMPTKPSFRKLPKDYITDEDRSVKWNREQVEINHQKYQEEVARLNREKNKVRDTINKDIYKKIQEMVGYEISEKAAKKFGIGHIVQVMHMASWKC